MTHGCHNRPPIVDGYAAQDGKYANGSPLVVHTPLRMGHHNELGKTYPACVGCSHRTDPEPVTAGSR